VAIYLLRHAETVSNATRVIQTPDAPLSDRGRDQAARLAARLRTAGIGRILASDLARALATAEILRDATKAPLELDTGLQERNFGDLRGIPYADLDGDPFAPDYVPPGGESWETFHRRVDRAWARVLAAAAETDGHTAVVTHGLVCLSVVTRHCELCAGTVLPSGWGNTSVTLVDAEPPWRVRLVDCTAHLDGRATGGSV
jgi:broad specificity phosphatase PhoE